VPPGKMQVAIQSSFLFNLKQYIMRKVILSITIAFLLFSSFTTSNVRGLKPTEGVSWHVEETFVYNNVTLFLCNGDLVLFPEYSVKEDIHGVNNGNLSMVQGKLWITGTGYSINTGEVYIINDEQKLFQKIPITNGAIVFNEKYNGILTGNQGSKDNYIAKSHLTINAKGEVTANKFELNGECQ
jgi:hypothetical protein